MSLARVSINKPVFAWMLMAALILFGLVAFNRIGVSELPDVDFPVVNVAVTQEGAAPEVIESDVVDVIENGIMGTTGLRNISSTSRNGSANITLEFDLDRNVDLAMQEVQSKINQVQKTLPRDVDQPIITKFNPEDQPIMFIALSGNVSQRELMTLARDKVISLLQLVPGVGDIFFSGFLEPNIRVWVDAEKLERYELSTNDILDAIKNEHVELPAGTLQKGEREFTIRVVGEALSPEEFGEIAINKRGGLPNFGRIKLRDVARVEAGLEDARRTARAMGHEAVGMGIRKQRGMNAVQVAKGVRTRIAEINKILPNGLNIAVNFDSTRFIEESIHELEFELFLSALLTGLVCWLFLGSWSSTFNILMAIPTSLIGALTGLYFAGFTLNTFTFLGLILAVGIVVDDAIMVLENIVRHREAGEPKDVAALKGANQITFAALATTLAIIAIFIPVMFMQGIIGKFFLQFGVTISVTVALSLLEALTLTPMRCAEFLYVPPSGHGMSRTERLLETLSSIYKRTLQVCLNHRVKVCLLAVAVFALSFSLLGGMRKEFIPPQDQSMFLVRLQSPVGSSLEYTDKLIRAAEDKVKQIPEVKRYFAAVGGVYTVNQVNAGMLFLTLKPKNERHRSQAAIMAVVRNELKQIKDLRASVQDLSSRGFSAQRGYPIEFSVRGSDWGKLVSQATLIKEELKKDPRFTDVDTNFEEGMPEIKVIPLRDKAVEYGVSIEDIASAVGYLVGGDRVARFTESGRRIDVRVKLEENFRTDPQSILNLNVRNNRGQLIRLGEVARLDVRPTLVSITREQRERAIGLFSNVAPGASQAAMVSTVENLGGRLSEGYRIVLSGNTKAFGDSFKSLMFALYLGIAVAYMILASQFNSFIHPVTVLLALPFSLSGAWLALRLGNQSINIYSMIGLILLMGIVKKNSIMLVDFTNQLRSEGMDVRDALLKACPLRLRPIIMTSIAIIAAALPSVFGLGPGSETRIPMSLSVVGGVALSTFFTLYVVPCAYSLFSRLESKKKRKAFASEADVLAETVSAP